MKSIRCCCDCELPPAGADACGDTCLSPAAYVAVTAPRRGDTLATPGPLVCLPRSCGSDVIDRGGDVILLEVLNWTSWETARTDAGYAAAVAVDAAVVVVVAVVAIASVLVD